MTRPDPGPRPVAFAFLLLLVLTQAPYVVATLAPPPGRAFVGTFRFADDFHNYLSYAQQAEHGAFLFQNRVLLEEHPPALINLEWWLIGLLSALLGGGQLVLSYRVVGAVSTLAFLLVADRWLRRLRMDAAHRLPALLLIATGGGLGGFLYTFAGREGLDYWAGLFPYLGLLTNPHFIVGTTLVLWSLLLFDQARGAREQMGAVAVATAVGVIRPYDLVLLVLVRTATVLLREPARRWFGALLPLAGLVPVVLYLYWLFYLNPAFSFFTQTDYVYPKPWDFVGAVAPATLLALPGLLRRADGAEAEGARLHLVAWAVVGLVVGFFHPVRFALQFLVGIGLPLLALGAFWLRRRRPAATWLAALVFSTSCLVMLRQFLSPSPFWFVPKADMELVRALRSECAPGDIVFAPPSVGVLAFGLTPCRAYLSHEVDPGYQDKLAKLGAFSTMTPAERAALLDTYRITHLLLPGDAGPVPRTWLGLATPFARSPVTAGAPVWSLYVRPRRPVAP